MHLTFILQLLLICFKPPIKLEKVFLLKKHSCGCIAHILFTHLFHYSKSFKDEHLFFIFLFFMSGEQHCIISTEQIDISLIYRSFSLKIIKLPSFLKPLKCRVYHCLQIVFMCSDEFTAQL